MANLNENKLITLGNLKRYTENVIDLIDEVKLTAGANIKITSGGVISALGYKLDTSNGNVDGVTIPKNSIAIGVLDSFDELNNEKNQALGVASFSQGYVTTASTTGSHSEGLYTLASGIGSHAEGASTTAYGGISHAEGYGTIAYNPYSHAEGQYNISGGSYIHVIGNGYGESVRSNAHTMDLSGNSRNAGDVYGGVVWNNNGTVKSYKHALSEKLDTSDISNSALEVYIDGEQLGSTWKTIDNQSLYVNFKHGPGINIRGTNYGDIIFSTDCNHTVTEKTQVVISEQNSTFYKLDVVCDLAGGNMTAVDLSDLADEKCIYPENKYRSFKWHKSSSEVDKYAGIVFASSIDGNFVFKLNIQNTLDGSNESHLYGFIVDTPPNATFTFATTNSWPIEIRVDDNNRLYAYLKIPDKFAGEIELIPLRSKIRSGAWMSSFYISNNTTITSLNWSGDPVSTGNVVTSEFEYPLISKNEIYGDVINGGITVPYGNYLVDVIADFGGGLVVGDKIADDVINDYLIHTIQKRLKQHIDDCTNYGNSINELMTIIEENEEVIAASLTDLDERINNINSKLSEIYQLFNK